MSYPIIDPTTGQSLVSTLPHKPFYKNMTIQVLLAVAIGLGVGAKWPQFGMKMKWFSDAFINAVKMIVVPVIFLTVSLGIAKMGDLKKVGRVGGKALFYFEVVTTLALLIGFVVANVAKPGHGVSTSNEINKNEEVQKVYKKNTEDASKAHKSFDQFLLGIIPKNIFAALAGEDTLPVLFFAILIGIAMSSMGAQSHKVIEGFEHLTEVIFRLIAMIMKFSPVGAFGAMAYTVGAFGLKSLVPLGWLMLCVYTTMAVFIFGILGLICYFSNFSLIKLLHYIRHEILLVFGTSSSEPALPRMMLRLEEIGCGSSVVRLVIPTGYSFNLDGTSIYLSMAFLFIAQAFNVHLSLVDQLKVMGILIVVSKGAAAVTGGGLIALSATLTATTQLGMKPEWLIIIVGVDRFMSEARAITNVIGNGVATVVVSKMEKDFDQQKYEAAMKRDRRVNSIY